ncbi:MAG: enhanced serine sensitivity protein SseB C-terminal domain-containing protein [Arsenophonus endosymbiont of Dermacentor nuttalli]
MVADKMSQSTAMTTITVPGGSVMKLSIPETLPQKLIDTLCQFFKQYKVIRRVFLVQAKDDTSTELPVMLIALEVSIGRAAINPIVS